VLRGEKEIEWFAQYLVPFCQPSRKDRIKIITAIRPADWMGEDKTVALEGSAMSGYINSEKPLIDDAWYLFRNLVKQPLLNMPKWTGKEGQTGLEPSFAFADLDGGTRTGLEPEIKKGNSR
jgi:hypothetical protein